MALAQQSPEMQAIGNKLIAEINAGIVCGASAITQKQEIDKLQAEIKALKDKYEPQPAPASK